MGYSSRTISAWSRTLSKATAGSCQGLEHGRRRSVISAGVHARLIARTATGTTLQYIKLTVRYIL